MSEPRTTEPSGPYSDIASLALLEPLVTLVDPAQRLGSGVRSVLRSAGELQDVGSLSAASSAAGIYVLDEAALLSTPFPRLQEFAPRLLVCLSRDSESMIPDLLDSGVRHLVGKTDDNEVDASELLVTVNKLLRREVFGLSKYFNWGARYTRYFATSTLSQTSIVARAADFAQSVGASSRFVELFCFVTGELLANALYHSPTGQERLQDRGLLQSDHFELKSSTCPRVKLGTDGMRLAVGVEDPFGRLTADRIRAHLAAGIRDRSETSADTALPADAPGSDGRGLGLYLSFRLMTQMVFNLDFSKRTEVLCFLDTRGGFRAHSGRAKSFHIFTAG